MRGQSRETSAAVQMVLRVPASKFTVFSAFAKASRLHWRVRVVRAPPHRVLPPGERLMAVAWLAGWLACSCSPSRAHPLFSESKKSLPRHFGGAVRTRSRTPAEVVWREVATAHARANRRPFAQSLRRCWRAAER